jgi:hypothetical protein
MIIHSTFEQFAGKFQSKAGISMLTGDLNPVQFRDFCVTSAEL